MFGLGLGEPTEGPSWRQRHSHVGFASMPVRSWCVLFSPGPSFVSVEIPFAKGRSEGLVSCASLEGCVGSHEGSADCSLRFTFWLLIGRLPNVLPTSKVYILGVESSGS